MIDIPLWKIAVAKPLELEDVMAAADDTPAATGVTADVRGVELQRVDRTDDDTVIFVTSGKEGARAIGDRTGGDAKLDEARAKDLASRDPIKA